MGGWDRWWLGDGVVDSYQGVGGGIGGVYYLIVFLLLLLSFVLSCSLSLF